MAFWNLFHPHVPALNSVSLLMFGLYNKYQRLSSVQKDKCDVADFFKRIPSFRPKPVIWILLYVRPLNGSRSPVIISLILLPSVTRCGLTSALLARVT